MVNYTVYVYYVNAFVICAVVCYCFGDILDEVVKLRKATLCFVMSVRMELGCR